MTKLMSIDERILAKFLEKIAADDQIPSEVVSLIRDLCEQEPPPDSSAILGALRQGVKEHAKNSTT